MDVVQPQVRRALPLAALLLGNSVPLFGALFLHWNLLETVSLFWLENFVVMFFTVLRLAIVKAKEPWAFKLFMIPFFLLHYGAFTLGHGGFLLLLTGADVSVFLSSVKVVAFALAGSFVGHAVSFVQYFLLNGEWKKPTMLGEIMGRPYRRVMVMHVTIIGGAFLFTFFPQNAVFPLLLIMIKTVVDVWSHMAIHADAEDDLSAL